MNETHHDLIDNHIDVAIRTREFESDSSITIRRLAATRRILAASPGYLDACGFPLTVEELANHSILIYTYSNQPNDFAFRRGDEVREARRCVIPAEVLADVVGTLDAEQRALARVGHEPFERLHIRSLERARPEVAVHVVDEIDRHRETGRPDDLGDG